MQKYTQFTSLHGREHQRGTVIILVMLILAGATILAVGSMDSALFELRMAAAQESSTQNSQLNHAAIDYAISDTSVLPSSGALGVYSSITLPDPVFALEAGDTLDLSAARLEDCGPPPRSDIANSLSAFSSFKYEIKSTLTQDASGRGRSEMLQGYLLLGPKC